MAAVETRTSAEPVCHRQRCERAMMTKGSPYLTSPLVITVIYRIAASRYVGVLRMQQQRKMPFYSIRVIKLLASRPTRKLRSHHCHVRIMQISRLDHGTTEKHQSYQVDRRRRADESNK